MKVVLCCRVYPTQRGGGMPFVTQDRAHELARHGFDVHVLTTGLKDRPHVTQEAVTAYVKGDMGLFLEQPGAAQVTVHHLDCPSGPYTDQFAQECRKTVDHLSPDLIHLDGLDTSRPWWDGLDVAVTLHGFGWGGILTSWQMARTGRHPWPGVDVPNLIHESQVMAKARRIITVSAQEQWLARDLYGLKNATVVYNPIAWNFFLDGYKPLPQKPRFAVASLHGHAQRCWDWVTEVVHGAGFDLITCANKPRDQMPAVFDGCSAAIVASLYEQGFDLTVAEANARGRQVIAFDVGSYGVEARLGYAKITAVPPLDREAFVEALRTAPCLNVQLEQSRHHPTVHVDEWLKAVGI